MLPFAYIKSLVHKWMLYNKKRKMRKLVEALTFIVTGMPILLINQFYDYMAFLKHIYSWDMKQILVERKHPKVSLAAFNKFHEIIKSKQGDEYNAKKLILEIR